MSHAWHENEEPNSRRFSVESEDQGALPLGLRKLSKKRSRMGSDSHFGSFGSNLNQISQGPLEVNKMFLTDDYFSDVNPRSMRRLMNVIYVMGRLLKAFSIDFNWHHLASWANITEQWPYHTSWIILFVENYGDKLEDGMSLKQVYDKVNPFIPTQKEMEPLIEYDRDRKKLDVYLSLHKKTLSVADIKVYMPFTINLDPYLRKVIKEEVQNMEEFGMSLFSSHKSSRGHEEAEAGLASQAALQSKALLTRRQAVELSKKMTDLGLAAPVPGLAASLPTPTYPYPYLPQLHPGLAPAPPPARPAHTRPLLPRELQGKVRVSTYLESPCICDIHAQVLSSLTLDQVCLLLRTIEGINTAMADTYCASVMSSNITGQVPLHLTLPRKNIC